MGIIGLVLVVVLYQLFRLSPQLYDVLYLKGVFQAFRIVHAATIGALFIPSLFIIVPLYFWFFFNGKARKKHGWIKSTMSCFIWIVVLFYVTWGFNYTQPSLMTRLSYDKPIIDSAYISQAFKHQTTLLVELKDKMTGNQYARDKQHDIRNIQESILKDMGYPTSGYVKVRKLKSGSLLHFRTSGIYIPHSFEGHIDNGLYQVQHPFTIAHEMSHGYGITDESEANFIAYLTCQRSEDLETRYSGELAYWRYLAKYYRHFHPETWKDEYYSMDTRIIQDLTMIDHHISKYKEWMPKYRDKIYDSYLKSHGVKAGIKSYDLMVVLIAAWKERRETSDLVD